MKSLQKAAAEGRDAQDELVMLRQKLDSLKSLEEVRKGRFKVNELRSNNSEQFFIKT